MLILSLLSAAALVVASPVGSVHDYAKAFEERAVTVTSQDLTNFKFYVQHAAAAYCNANTGAGKKITCGGACPALQGNAVTVVSSFSGSRTGIGGYVATDNARKEIVVSIRGSSNIRNWIANIDFLQTRCNLVSDCYVHTGFQNAWNEIGTAVRNAVTAAKTANPDYRIIAAGHSLGGAIATLAAAHLRKAGFAVDIYSFGAPRAGNAAFANFVTQQPGAEFRVTHNNDPVSRLPPIIFGYRHTSPEYWLAGGYSTKYDYAVRDIRVCEGTDSIGCNGGTFGLDILAHLSYLQDVSACAPIGIFWRDQISDEELEQRLNEYSQKDQEFVEELETGESTEENAEGSTEESTEESTAKE